MKLRVEVVGKVLEQSMENGYVLALDGLYLDWLRGRLEPHRKAAGRGASVCVFSRLRANSRRILRPPLLRCKTVRQSSPPFLGLAERQHSRYDPKGSAGSWRCASSSPSKGGAELWSEAERRPSSSGEGIGFQGAHSAGNWTALRHPLPGTFGAFSTGKAGGTLRDDDCRAVSVQFRVYRNSRLDV